MVLPSSLERFLAEPHVAVLATVRRDGAPASTPCWYDVEDGRVLVTMYASARRAANVAPGRPVSLTVLDEDPYKHLTVSGHVVERWEDPDMVVMDRLSRRYTGEPWSEREPCVSATIEIARWHSYGLLSESSIDHGPAAAAGG